MGSEPPPAASQAEDRNAADGGVLDTDFFERCLGRFPDPVIVFDLKSSLLFLNACAKALTGYEPGGGSSLPYSGILREMSLSQRSSLVDRCLQEGILDRVPVQLRSLAGDWLPFSLCAQPAAGPDGRPAGVVAVLRNAPAYSRTMESLLDPIFSSVINNFPMPFFTVDTDLTITYMNDHLEKLSGYSCSEVVNRMTCAELLRTAECNTEIVR